MYPRGRAMRPRSITAGHPATGAGGMPLCRHPPRNVRRWSAAISAAAMHASTVAARAVARPAGPPLCQRRHSSSVPSSAAAHAPASASRPGTGRRQLGSSQLAVEPGRARQGRGQGQQQRQAGTALLQEGGGQGTAGRQPSAARLAQQERGLPAGAAAPPRRAGVPGRLARPAPAAAVSRSNAYMPTTAPYALGYCSNPPSRAPAELISGSAVRA